MTPYNTPIYNYLREYAKQNINIFHMPGHKLTKGMPYELAQDILKLDVTEIDGTDNLHYPEGIIKEAEELAAKAFGADKTFFLVNGSTCGIQAAIMSVCARGQKIIIGRDSHKSVVSGLILSGAEPVFVYPQYNCEFGITTSITAESIEKSLCQHPDAVAVLITRPNYYGICSDIEKISSIVHAYNKLLIVDEAHGAHLAFNEKLPPSAIKYGADICIQSAHKTLPAVTQGAYLHVKGSRVDIDKLKFNLTMFQTSSPSYIIMSYLDIARELMELYGKTKLNNLLDEISWFKQQLKKYPEYKILSNEVLLNRNSVKSNLTQWDLDYSSLNQDSRTKAIHNSEYIGNSEATTKSKFVSSIYSQINTIRNSVEWEIILHDPTRLVINISQLGISGYYGEKLLREKFKTQVEMADYENLVFITTIADNHDTFSRLLESLAKLSDMMHKEKTQREKSQNEKSYKEKLGNETPFYFGENIGLLPYEAYIAQKEEVPIEESCERICAGVITPYPPGIPVLYPGEIIKKNQIDYLISIIQAGGKINGISRNKCVQVVK